MNNVKIDFDKISAEDMVRLYCTTQDRVDFIQAVMEIKSKHIRYEKYITDIEGDDGDSIPVRTAIIILYGDDRRAAVNLSLLNYDKDDNKKILLSMEDDVYRHGGNYSFKEAVSELTNFFK